MSASDVWRDRMNDYETREPRKTDSQVAAEWSAQAMADGRLELGFSLARIAVQAERMERGSIPVPLLGSTREEHPRAATPIHEQAATELFGRIDETAQLQAVPTAPSDRCRHVYRATSSDGSASSQAECHQVIYWQADGSNQGNGSWLHLNPEIEKDHPAIPGSESNI